MSNEDIPSWLKEDEPDTTLPPKGKSQQQYVPPMPKGPYENLNQPSHSADMSKYKEIVFWSLKILTLLLCILMTITAVVGFTYVNGINETGQVMVAFYMIVFALILAIFEIIQIRPIESLDAIYRRNFGFLYGTKGKSFFIIFIAFLSFGITEPPTLCLLTGLLVAAFGALELGIFLKYPELFEECT